MVISTKVVISSSNSLQSKAHIFWSVSSSLQVSKAGLLRFWKVRSSWLLSWGLGGFQDIPSPETAGLN